MPPSIVIRDADPQWPEEFRRLGHVLRTELGDLAVRIDHIGSTAVPGLAAKDVIDVQITVVTLGEAGVTGALARAGGRETDIGEDHCPPGLTMAPDELRKRLYIFDAPLRRANVHVREDGRFNQRYALLCRDYLVTHPEAADAYADIKRQLARHFPEDVEAYYDVKDPVFDLLMASAREWADWTGWHPPPSDA